MNDKKVIKDVRRGRCFARLADGATLFDPADDSHVKSVTPLQTKQRELQDDPRYRTDLDAGINEVRQDETRRKRMDKEVKPI